MYNPSHNAPLILILFDLYIASFGVALTWPAEGGTTPKQALWIKLDIPV